MIKTDITEEVAFYDGDGAHCVVDVYCDYNDCLVAVGIKSVKIDGAEQDAQRVCELFNDAGFMRMVNNGIDEIAENQAYEKYAYDLYLRNVGTPRAL